MSTHARDVTPYTGEDANMRRVPRVRLVLDMTRAEAEALANAPRTAGGDLYADQAREVAEPIAAALVAAGVGS